MMFEDDLLDIQQAAAFLRCSVDTLRRVPRSQLPVYRPGRHNLYFRRDLMAFARSRPAGAGAKIPTTPDAPLKDQDLVDFVADRVRERSSTNRRTL